MLPLEHSASPWSILQYFWSALSDNRSWKPIFCLFEWPLKTGFTVLKQCSPFITTLLKSGFAEFLLGFLKIGVKMLSTRKVWSFTIPLYWDCKSWSQNQKVGVKWSKFGVALKPVLRGHTKRRPKLVFKTEFVLIFVWFGSLLPINNLSVKQGRVLLGWTNTELG